MPEEIREQLKRLRDALPFTPFIIDVAEDVAYSIPHRDFLLISPFAAVVQNEDGYIDLVPYTHIRRIRTQAEAIE